jgi:hypothetical protein
MANDRDNPDAKPDDVHSKGNAPERKRVIGKGMTSPDSTQVPLKAETGEPDMDAIKGRIPPEQDKSQPKGPS